ncbi:CYTH domain-containing protein [Candidatus Nomurabacteria bacterium]|nr:CYTH domain-containing protein [Candidatus Nomurabacteria bacterium]
MIEVEKKFKPTEEQLKAILEGAVFLGKVINHDIYYDYPDYRMYKKEIRLRNRNGNFELKIGDDAVKGVAEEIEGEENIQKYLKLEEQLSEFIEKNLVEIINYKTSRDKYKKDDFSIDVDSTDFGYDMVEIELMIDDKSKTKEAEERIVSFALSAGLSLSKLPGKTIEYLKRMNPELYKKIFINKEIKGFKLK